MRLNIVMHLRWMLLSGLSISICVAWHNFVHRAVFGSRFAIESR